MEFLAKVKGVLLLLASTALIVLIVSRSCERYKPIEKAGLNGEQLPAEQQSRATVTSKCVVLANRRGNAGITTVAQRIPEGSKVEIVASKEGVQQVRVSRWGFTSLPGVAGVYILRPSLSLDYKFLYVKDFGLLVGVPIVNQWPGPYVAISYSVYRNTSLFLGYCPLTRRPAIGARISF